VVEADVAAEASPGRILVIATREDLTMMRETRRLLDSVSKFAEGSSANNLIKQYRELKEAL